MLVVFFVIVVDLFLVTNYIPKVMVYKKSLVCLLTLFMALAMCAQTPVTTLPYFCDFEDVHENANWTLNRRGGFGASTPLPSVWGISTGAKHSGFNGLYIYSNDDITRAEYDGDHEVFVVADRTFNLPIGTYDLALDWRCLGDAINDAIFVYWVPATTNVTSRTTSALVSGQTPLTFNGDNFLSGSATWQQARSTITVARAQEYRLIIAWRNNSTRTYNPGACIDNIQINYQESATDCWHTVTNLTWTQGTLSDVLSWTGQPGATYDVYYWLEGSLQVDSIMGITGTSVTFRHGELLSGLYTFAVRTNCGTNQSILTELLNVKSLGDYSMIVDACPEVDLIASSIVNGEKYMLPSCDETGKFHVKPNVTAGGGAIAGYRVDEISYGECPFPFDLENLPANQRNQITTITRDDYWDTQLINLPFAVCFFEGTYRQALVGANGLVTFDPSIQPNSNCAWSLTGQPNIPSAEFQYMNCIMGVYQDYYPVPSAGGRQQIWYGVLGEWPCRKMVVCFNEVPMFQNHDIINSSMIVVYEGTNVIDVYVKNRDLSPSGWNGNRGIIGVINADGTDGVAAPGRNTHDVWSAHQEAWRFTPYSTPLYTLTWYKGAFSDPAVLDTYILEHPNEDLKLSFADSIEVSEADSINAVTVRLQYSQCNGDYIDLLDHAYIQWPHTDTVRVDTTTCQGRTYSDRYVQFADHTGLYEAVIADHRGCDSIIYQLNLTVLTKDTIEYESILCEGQTLEYGGFHITEPGVYPIPLKYSNCDCDSLLQLVTFRNLENLNVTIDNEQTQVCADDPVITLSYNVIGGKADKYDFVFDAVAHEAGFADMLNQPVQNAADINIPIMTAGDQSFRRPGTYHATLTFYDKNECTNQSFDVQFEVLFPSSLIYQRWDDVLSVSGPQFNGGYQFSGFQWLQNGQAIDGAVKSYYYAPNKLDMASLYQVLLTDMNGNKILSCPFTPQPANNPVNVSPSRVRVGEQVMVTVPANARVDFYNILGHKMNATSVVSGSTMVTVPDAPGMYVVILSMEDGDRSFRINVTE